MNKNRFSPGDLLQSSRYPNYLLFVERFDERGYFVWHTHRFENDGAIFYAKNAGHDCLLTINKLEKDDKIGYGLFTKVGSIPGLLGRNSVRIQKN